MFRFLLYSTLLICSLHLNSQKEFNNWTFGDHCALNFNVTPPAASTCALKSSEACASVSDASGALLFYTDGVTVWNNQHTTMANGTGLAGHQSTSQGAIIVKRPSSLNQYYIITLDAQGGSNGLNYSVVDMSLSSGQGSVTAKNINIYGVSSEKLAVAPHCNRKDHWLISQSFSGFDFRVFPITSAGISTVAVISPFPNNGNLYFPTGSIKLSHNGKWLITATTYPPLDTSTAGFHLYDFDNATGVVSNQKNLLKVKGAYAAEFSPDDSKLYGAINIIPNSVYQWDLCHDSLSGIQNSSYILGTSLISRGHLQEGPNGKIYMARVGQSFLGVIQNPDAPAPACNFVELGQQTSGWVYNGLPNNARQLNSIPNPSYSTGPGCAISFSVQLPGDSLSGCGLSPSPAWVLWNFGDPVSATSNTSNALFPLHYFSSGGTYTTQVIRNYGCYTDTTYLIVKVNHLPAPGISGKTSVCVKDSIKLVASGATTFTWSTGLVSPTLVITPSVGGLSSYTLSASSVSTSCISKTVVNVSVDNCLGVTKLTLPECRLFPNPANNFLIVECVEKLHLKIMNGLGQVLKFQYVLSGRSQIPVGELNAGNYMISLTDKDGNRGYFHFVKTD